MLVDYNKFYKEKSEKFKKYSFRSNLKIIKGEKPDFIGFVKKYADKKLKILDLGCGSGELTRRLAPHFGQVIGVDFCEEYIKAAQKNNKNKNAEFIVADGKKLPFDDNYFDIVLSVRGPLSEGVDFLKEGKRVVKGGGFLIEETIGEKDKLEIKRIFGRGQNYPIKGKRIEDIKSLLKKVGIKIVFFKNYFYLQKPFSIGQVINILDRAPIIPDFDKKIDKDKIKKIEKETEMNKKFLLSSHRLIWVGQNK